MMKAICDVFTQSGVVIDDCYRYMRGCSVEWEPNLPAGKCSVTITELSPEPIARPIRAKVIQPKAKASLAPIMLALKARGINVSPDRVHVQ